MMVEYISKNNYQINFVYNDFSVEAMNSASIEINIDKSAENDTVILDMIERTDTNFQFAEIRWVILDIGSDDRIVTRKLFEVEFIKYKQKYFHVSQGLNKNMADFKVEFIVKNFEIYQDSDLIALQVFMRELKLKYLLN